MRNQIMVQLRQEKIVAILRGINVETCVKTVEALYQGGIRLVEITFNQKDPSTFPETAAAIRAISQQFQDKIIPGAGTVLTREQVSLAANAGARYIISPDTNRDVISYTRALGLVSMPGALTPSEIVKAHQWGADFVKVFPATTLGTAYIKAVKAPVSHIPLIAVGGIDETNLGDFLEAGYIGAGVGGSLVNKEWIKNDAFSNITEAAKRLVAIAKGV